jgi:hypothetical protein
MLRLDDIKGDGEGARVGCEVSALNSKIVVTNRIHFNCMHCRVFSVKEQSIQGRTESEKGTNTRIIFGRF